MPLSGPQWVNQFPTSRRVEDLAQPFQTNVQNFIGALEDAGATVTVAATLRPPQRAYLMHFSFLVAHGFDPAQVPPMPGVDIQWMHTDAQGNPDRTASQAAAQQMVQGYDIVFAPALTSRHSEGNAIDMDITWPGDLDITDGNGNDVTITSVPRTGNKNTDLHQVGLSYGVHKLLTDPPHWSSDGH